MALRPCPACDRHVLTSNVACPFCDAALERAEEVARPPSGLGRVALIAFATGVAACHGEPKQTVPDPTPTVTATATATATDTASAAGTATGTAIATATATATATTATASAASVDAGVKKDAGAKTAVTATATATWHNLAKPYGAPPSRDRRSV